MKSPMEIIADVSRMVNAKEPADYYDGGFLHCGECHEPKEKEVVMPAVECMGIAEHKITVGVMCRCKREEKARQEAIKENNRHRELVDLIRKKGISDNKYLDMTFDADDGSAKTITATCKTYVESWQDMRKENIGMILWGDVGTGKTFHACEIANALADKEIGVMVSTVPEIISKLQAFGDDRENTMYQIKNVSLLVLDDFGAERSTEYALEQLFNIVDARSRSGKPLIVTTNIPIDEMMNTTDFRLKRIYDRVLEMCPIKIKVDGISKRREKDARRTEIARNIIKRGMGIE